MLRDLNTHTRAQRVTQYTNAQDRTSTVHFLTKTKARVFLRRPESENPVACHSPFPFLGRIFGVSMPCAWVDGGSCRSFWSVSERGFFFVGRLRGNYSWPLTRVTHRGFFDLCPLGNAVTRSTNSRKWLPRTGH